MGMLRPILRATSVLVACSVVGDAFVSRPSFFGGNRLRLFSFNGGCGGHGAPPTGRGNEDNRWQFYDEDGSGVWIGSLNVTQESIDSMSQIVQVRGGVHDATPADLLKGSKVTLSKIGNFWKAIVATARAKVKNAMKSKEQQEEDRLLESLKTTNIRHVTVPNSTVLPADVIRVAVKRSGLIGSPLRTDRVQDIARSLKRWYNRKGYILHSVTGAILQPGTATAELTVQEPKVSNIPVSITVCKEMIVDDGQLLTYRQYVKKHSERKTFRHDRIQKKDLNTTLVSTKGRTSASKIAKALKLNPGMPFRWHNQRWQRVASSGIFSQILRASPERAPDGSVVLQVYATEPPPRHLEYGLGKSLYTGSWEGELDFEHQNLFGGGETVGLIVRRGTKDAAPSYRLRYTDEKFGLERGYDMEVFSDYIGDASLDKSKEGPEEARNVDVDSLLDRKGGTITLRNPIKPSFIQNSIASASLERTCTRTGLHENIGSTTLTLGPFRKSLPMDARSSISTTITGGTRVGGKEPSSTSFLNFDLLPFSLISATARQVLPLNAQNSGGRRPALALQHTVTTSTSNLPRHDAKAMGISAQIRGASPDGCASSSLKGTAELRVPISMPKMGSGSMVFFGDWFFVQSTHKEPFYSKSSIGIGLRKNVQGLPLKYDLCYSSEGKVKAMFGLGVDFDA